MARIRWRTGGVDPLAEFDRLREEINQLFDLPPVPTVRGLFDRPVSPAMDLTEDGNEFRVVCDVPGLRREDLDISLAQGVLTIKGDKRAPKRGGKARVYREETWEGKFQRTISMPSQVDPAKVTADLADGVLTVTLPKREEAKAKQISIQAK